MRQIEITNGSRKVIGTEQGGTWEGRLYRNHGETATLCSWKGKTEAGLRRWAKKVIA